MEEADKRAIWEYFTGHQMEPRLTGVLMQELVHEVDWDEFATRHDVADLRGDIARIKADVNGLKLEMIALEGRFNERLNDKLAATEGRLRAEISDLSKDMADRFRKMTALMASFQVGTIVAVAAIVRLV